MKEEKPAPLKSSSPSENINWNQLLIKSSAPSNQEIEALERAVFSVTPPRQLEQLGPQLTLAHLLCLAQRWTAPALAEKWEGRLAPLLIGLPQSLFKKFLLAATPNQLQPILLEASGEPLLHHLTRLVHEEEVHLNDLGMRLVDLEQEIKNFQIEQVSYQHTALLLQKLSALSDNCHESILLLDKALMLAWNSPRSDLVESLSLLKERFQRFDSQVIGDSPKPGEVATGLYALLQKRLDRVFGSTTLNNQDVEGLKDNEPAVEALAKLSLWYLEDYYTMGLLPSVKSLDEIQQHLNHLNRDERAIYRLERFLEAKETLEKAGLHTVGDFKRAHLFSAAALKDYLTANLFS